MSTGDLIRGAPQNTPAKRLAAAGKLVSDSIVFDLLAPFLEGSGGFILDGLPRTLAQARELQRLSRVDRIVSISMREDVLIRKSVARRICPECGVSFNLADVNEPGFVMPPILPTAEECIARCCIDRFQQRPDDTESVVRARLRIFHATTAPVVDFYRSIAANGPHETSLHEIDVTGGADVMTPIFETALGIRHNWPQMTSLEAPTVTGLPSSSSTE